MDLSSALRVCLFLLGCGLANCVVPESSPQVSGDVLIAQGESFEFTCDFKVINWATTEGYYVQIYKQYLDYHRLLGTDLELQNGDTLLWLITTNTQLNPEVDSSRYQVSFDTTSSLLVNVSDAQAEDRGLWKCRMILENSTSTTIEERVSVTGANITIITPIVDMAFVTADYMRSSWMYDYTVVTDEVTLNHSDPIRFACKVEYNSVLPGLSAYFETSDGTKYWIEDLQDYWRRTQPATEFIYRGEFTRVYVDTLFLSVTTEIMMHLRYLDDTRFVCVASLPLYDDMELAIHVTAQGGPYDQHPNTSSIVTFTPGHLILALAFVGILYRWQNV